FWPTRFAACWPTTKRATAWRRRRIRWRSRMRRKTLLIWWRRMQTRQQLIEFLGSKARRVHFVGIGGCGMSGLARILLQQGHYVTGSDLAPNGETTGLRKLGAKIFTGHAARHVHLETELLIYTAAI